MYVKHVQWLVDFLLAALIWTCANPRPRPWSLDPVWVLFKGLFSPSAFVPVEASAYQCTLVSTFHNFFLRSTINICVICMISFMKSICWDINEWMDYVTSAIQWFSYVVITNWMCWQQLELELLVMLVWLQWDVEIKHNYMIWFSTIKKLHAMESICGKA